MQIRTINKAIAELGIKAELIKGDGYFYFIGNDVACGQIDSVMVFKLNDLTFDLWMQELAYAVEQSKRFLNASHSPNKKTM